MDPAAIAVKTLAGAACIQGHASRPPAYTSTDALPAGHKLGYIPKELGDEFVTPPFFGRVGSVGPALGSKPELWGCSVRSGPESGLLHMHGIQMCCAQIQVPLQSWPGLVGLGIYAFPPQLAAAAKLPLSLPRRVLEDSIKVSSEYDPGR